MKDEYHGQGGSYLLDPETGKRTLTQRTLPADPPEKNDSQASKKKSDSDRNRIYLRDGSDANRSGRSLGEGSEYNPSTE